jgi:outer membrane lipoprotein-sorting protein
MNKKLLALGLPVLLTALVVAVMLSSVNVTIQVDEALSTTTTDLTLSPAYAGETITQTIPVENKANVPLNVELSWTETENLNGVTYTTDMSKTVEIPALSTADVEVSFTFATDTELGEVTGQIVLERVA